MWIKILIFIISFYILLLNANPFKFKQNKINKLNFIDNKYKPKTELVVNIINRYSYPFILKPNYCSGLGNKVKLIKNNIDLNNYLDNNKDIKNIIIQEFIPYKNEVGILYERNPLLKDGKIISIVKGRNLGGTKVNQDDCELNIKNENKNYLITEKLNKLIDTISKSIPDLYVCRYDIRYKDEKSLKNGTNFYILEVNGVGGLDGRFFGMLCLNTFLKAKFNKFIYLFRWLIIRLLYGLINLIMFNAISMVNIIDNVKYSIKCRNLGNLIEN